MRGKTNLTRPLKPLTSPVHDLIISPHVEHPTKDLTKKVCSPMQRFFMKKVPPCFAGGREDTMLYLEIFSYFQRFIPNFCGTNYNLSSKTTELLLLKSYSMVLKFPKLF